jgi:hypothetical protein
MRERFQLRRPVLRHWLLLYDGVDDILGVSVQGAHTKHSCSCFNAFILLSMALATLYCCFVYFIRSKKVRPQEPLLNIKTDKKTYERLKWDSLTFFQPHYLWYFSTIMCLVLFANWIKIHFFIERFRHDNCKQSSAWRLYSLWRLKDRIPHCPSHPKLLVRVE